MQLDYALWSLALPVAVLVLAGLACLAFWVIDCVTSPERQAKRRRAERPDGDGSEYDPFF
ncbi:MULTISPECIES: hypothetical protein [Pseudomonas]|uniref:hypothetical protein n=1 Tax=Pseudomonadaceae TaxID=135621 RepID=UPI00084BA83B|nr:MULTISPECIES: hypothetical protein [Pseudomonas]OEC52287.1 hypothetical protein A9G05_22285 [Pseudomonas sp. ENNP23]